MQRNKTSVTICTSPIACTWERKEDTCQGCSTTMSCRDKLHRISNTDDVLQSVDRPVGHNCAFLRHLGRCQPALSSSVSTMVQCRRWTGGEWFWNPESIMPTTSELNMAISTESAHDAQTSRKNWPPPCLALKSGSAGASQPAIPLESSG